MVEPLQNQDIRRLQVGADFMSCSRPQKERFHHEADGRRRKGKDEHVVLFFMVETPRACLPVVLGLTHWPTRSPPVGCAAGLSSWAVSGVDHPSPRGGKRQVGADMMSRIHRVGFHCVRHRLLLILCILIILSHFPSLQRPRVKRVGEEGLLFLPASVFFMVEPLQNQVIRRLRVSGAKKWL
jgi:hypothetical protein